MPWPRLPAFLRRHAAPPPPSSLLPTFLRRLADPAVRTVLLAGCGGGFDFLHAMLIYPELKHLGKKVIIGSYSFGHPEAIKGDAPTVFSEGDALVRRVSARCTADAHYGPEVHLCSFLDERFPAEAPHLVDAYYARAFTAPVLGRYYRQLVAEHAVDAIVLFDGGSDSLMVGDEEGLGDPIEDAVSIAAVAGLATPPIRMLVSVGLGADRFNHVSDAASLRAIAELTRLGGALGALVMEADSEAANFYRDAIAHIYARQSFRSVLTSTILGSIAGAFGADEPPPGAGNRVKAGDVFLWPLMSMLWAFDVNTVAARSQTVRWVASCATMQDCYEAVLAGRRDLASGTRPVEELPRHVDFRNQRGRFL